jgi:hypothetical protein
MNLENKSKYVILNCKLVIWKRKLMKKRFTGILFERPCKIQIHVCDKIKKDFFEYLS